MSMQATYANTLELVQDLIRKGTPITNAWRRVVAHLQDGATPTMLSAIRKCNVSNAVEQLESWLSKALAAKPPAKSIRGLRFGLFHPDVEGRMSCDFYLAGSSYFDADESGWGYDTSYLASGYPGLEALEQLNEVSLHASESPEKREALVHLCLWFALLAVATVSRQQSAMLLGRAKTRGIGVGFDSGDLVCIGTVSADGFVPTPKPTEKRQPRRPTLPKGEYFILEGGREVLLCNSVKSSMDEDCFHRCRRVVGLEVRARVDRQCPDQKGNYGSLYPFHAEFIPEAVALQIDDGFPQEVQFIPLKIIGRPGKWRIFNVLKRINALDEAATLKRKRLVLRKSIIGDRHIFGIRSYYNSAIFVSRAVAKLMIDAGVVGVTFIPVTTIA